MKTHNIKINRKDFVRPCKVAFTKLDYSIDERVCSSFEELIEFCNQYPNSFRISDKSIVAIPIVAFDLTWLSKYNKNIADYTSYKRQFIKKK